MTSCQCHTGGQCLGVGSLSKFLFHTLNFRATLRSTCGPQWPSRQLRRPFRHAPRHTLEQTIQTPNGSQSGTAQHGSEYSTRRGSTKPSRATKNAVSPTQLKFKQTPSTCNPTGEAMNAPRHPGPRLIVQHTHSKGSFTPSLYPPPAPAAWNVKHPEHPRAHTRTHAHALLRGNRP